MKKYTNILLIILFVILELFLLSKSGIVINSFTKTLNICLYNLMPTMFFSVLFSNILIKLHFERYMPKKLLKKLFNINDNETIIFLLSIISGYPNNSKMLVNCKNQNNIIHYTNFINPIFLIGTVGCVYLKNIKLIIAILISHYIGNIILGIILKNKNISNKFDIDIRNDNFLNIYSSSLKNTIYSLAIIFSNILFFSIILSLITNIIHLNEPFNSILIGLIEFSSGIYSICNTSINIFYKGLIILIIITFSSFSMHMQIISMNEKIKYIKYLLYRLFNVFISIIIYYVIYIIFYTYVF